MEGLGYTEPTKVQQSVIPAALERKDLVVKSQTGSGKTASFGIPLCELANWDENKPQALILTPTRELAVQVKEDITNIGRFKRIKATAVFGKSSFDKQKAELKQKATLLSARRDVFWIISKKARCRWIVSLIWSLMKRMRC